MNRPAPPVAAVRLAVREFLQGLDPAPELYVGVSGGADSLALLEGAVDAGRRSGVRVAALIVDHGLQLNSSWIADEAASLSRKLGADVAHVLKVRVDGRGGPEAAARRARYEALRKASDGAVVLLGHTLDDQAETVLLGLGRGSGPRSVAGMRPYDHPWGRPLLGVSRATTVAACAALDVEPWQDPHNDDPRYTRVRLRKEALPLLEDVLSGGVAAALARTAAQLREDIELLDTLAAALHERAKVPEGLEVAVLQPEPGTLRRRVLRTWLMSSKVRELTDAHLRAVDALVSDWHGQGGVWLPGGFEAGRAHGRLSLVTRPQDPVNPARDNPAQEAPAPTTRGD